MKKMYLLTVICLFPIFLCCNCSETEVTVPQITERNPVCFSVRLTEELIPFPVARAIPALDITDPVAKSAEDEKEIHTLCNTIEYIVFEEGKTTVPVRHIRYEYDENNSGFGIIRDSLPTGSYQMVFLAYNSCETTLDSNIMSFRKVTDTFHTSFRLEVEPGNKVDKSIVLQRVVSRIEFVSTDPVPENAKSFSMEIFGYPCRLDILTGHGIEPETTPVMYTHSFTEKEIGQTGLTYAFFAFVPSGGEATLNVNLTALDKEDKELRNRMVESVKPVVNHIVRYKGRLYSYSASDNEFIVSIGNDGEWEDEKEFELKEY